jgi:glycosyltransferase involved in cell wall biosynthesis
MNNTNNPKISIIIPVYNSELFIRRCLNSVIEQTFTDFEVILINDNSSDNSPAICNGYANKDNRIKVIHNSVNQGSSLSRKIGIDNVSGEYIQFIDSDDWIEKDMLNRLYSAAISNNYDIVWSDFYDNDFNYQEEEADNIEKIDMYKRLLDYRSKLTSSLWTKFIKKDILSEINFFKAMQWEDLVITVQLINKSTKIKHLSEALYHHVNNLNSITQSKERKIKGLTDIIENLTITINYLHEYLGADFIQLEPELSACVNRFKFESIFIKELRNSELFLQLYPESNKNIFCKEWKTKYYKKIFLYAYFKNIPGILLFFDLLKCIKY